MNALNSRTVPLVMAAAAGMLCASFASPIMAQSICQSCSTESEIATYLNTQAQPPAVQGSNASTVIQNGTNNTAAANMTVPPSVGTGSYSGNVTAQMQMGSNNVSDLQAVGNSNALVTSQIGNDNNTSITAYGSANTFVSTQEGNNLSYTLQRVGNGQKIAVTQKN